MLTTRTPFRVSFCGGGSDLPEFYRKYGGCVLSTSIDKYIYITMMGSFYPDRILVKYSQVENVSSPQKIGHKIFRDVFTRYGINGVDVNSLADVPAGTGLGSSSTFTVGLVNAVRTYLGMEVTKEGLAAEACETEIERLKGPIGKQDQYAAAYGGMNFIRFNKDDTVDVEPVRISAEAKRELNDRLMMFYLGGTRKADDVMSTYSGGSSDDNRISLCKLTERLKCELEKNNIDSLGRTLDEGWRLKRSISSSISSDLIDVAYQKALYAGAVGGKLLGAGGNGFMLLYVGQREKAAVREALSDFREMPFRFDECGSTVVYTDENRMN